MAEETALRVLIVEDERAAREELKYLLGQAPGVVVVGEASDGPAGLQEALTLEPDLVLLDIQIPGCTGLELARQLREELPWTQVVFATAYDEHAVEAFDLAATDYLLKPFEAERVARAVARAQSLREARAVTRTVASSEAPRRLAVERRHRTFFLELEEVAWIGMEDSLVTVAAIDGTHYGTDRTLRELEEELDPNLFFRCHREVIVNLARIREVRPHQSGTFRLVLDDVGRSEIPLARNRVRRLKELLPW